MNYLAVWPMTISWLMATYSYSLLPVSGLYTRFLKTGPPFAWISHLSDGERDMKEFCPASPHVHVTSCIQPEFTTTPLFTSNSDYQRSDFRIVNGTGAQRGMFPYAAALATDLIILGNTPFYYSYH